MKKLLLITALVVLTLALSNCDKSKLNKVKSVEVTIYPETEVGKGFMSDIWSDFLAYSDNIENDKRAINQIIFEGLDIDYQRGYEYRLKAKKIWMSNPPMDVSNVKYVITKLISKEKVITEPTQNIIEITVKPELVEYFQIFPNNYDENGIPKQIDAMLAFNTETSEPVIITEIDGFDYEQGKEYLLEVRKITEPDPFSVRYELVEIKDIKEL